MAPPSIALRFRDTNPEVDTIAAHVEVIQKTGAVWWAWWKKEFEDSEEVYLAALFKEKKDVHILIVDPSTARMFVAKCVECCQRVTQDFVVELVPQYYRDNIFDVFAWFRFVSLQEVKYDEEIGEAFKFNTFLRLLPFGKHESEKSIVDANVIEKSCILHLSDLHFGADYAYRTQDMAPDPFRIRKTLTECLSKDIETIGLHHDIAALIVTGDFITKGDWEDTVRDQVLSEFRALCHALSITPEQILAVPGNHDIVRFPESDIDVVKSATKSQHTYRHEREFRTFLEDLVGRSWKKPLNYVHKLQLKEVDLLVCILNSCTIAQTRWTEYGYVGTGLAAIDELKAKAVLRPTYKFLALHHHLLPVADVQVPQKNGVSLSLDAAKVLDAAQEAGIHVALHGHQHVPRIASFQTVPLCGSGRVTRPILIVSNGSTGAVRERLPDHERNTYCIFRLSERDVHLWLREIRADGKKGATLFEGKLDLKPESGC